MIAFMEDDVREAWARIGHSRDGQHVRAVFAAMLMKGIPTGLQDGALREEVGRMRLASEIVTLLDGLDGNRGRATDSPDVAVVRPQPEPPGSRGSRRRVPDISEFDQPGR